MFGFLLSLHVLVFALSFALTAGIGILLGRVVQSRNPRTIRIAFAAARPLSAGGGAGWAITAVTGFLLAWHVGIPLNQPWLLGSYAALAVLLISGIFLHNPWQAKVIAAAKESSDDTMSPELAAALRSPLNMLANVLSTLSVIALVVLMSAQPG